MLQGEGKDNTKHILHTCHTMGSGLKQSLIISKNDCINWRLYRLSLVSFLVLY